MSCKTEIPAFFCNLTKRALEKFLRRNTRRCLAMFFFGCSTRKRLRRFEILHSHKTLKYILTFPSQMNKNSSVSLFVASDIEINTAATCLPPIIGIVGTAPRRVVIIITMRIPSGFEIWRQKVSSDLKNKNVIFNTHLKPKLIKFPS